MSSFSSLSWSNRLPGWLTALMSCCQLTVLNFALCVLYVRLSTVTGYEDLCYRMTPAVNNQNEGILFGLLNTQSLVKNRSIAASDTIVTRHLDVLALTWHETSDDIQLKCCAPSGYSIVDAAHSDVILPRSVAEKGGGVAIIHSDWFIVKKIMRNVKPTTFGVLCCSLQSASVTFVHLVIYRPGAKPATDGFFDELIALLEIVGTFRNELASLVTSTFTLTMPPIGVLDDSPKFWSLST